MRQKTRKLCRVTAFPVAVLQETFSVNQVGRLTWDNPPKASRRTRGQLAGCPTYHKRGMYLNGVKVSFKGILIHAEDIVFTITKGRHPLPDHKIIHRDGNKLNNLPSNLVEVSHTLPR